LAWREKNDPDITFVYLRKLFFDLEKTLFDLEKMFSDLEKHFFDLDKKFFDIKNGCLVCFSEQIIFLIVMLRSAEAFSRMFRKGCFAPRTALSMTGL